MPVPRYNKVTIAMKGELNMKNEIEKSGVDVEKNIDELLERFKKVLEELEEIEQKIDNEGE